MLTGVMIHLRVCATTMAQIDRSKLYTVYVFVSNISLVQTFVNIQVLAGRWGGK